VKTSINATISPTQHNNKNNKMALEVSAEALSDVLPCRKTGMCLMEKMCFDKLLQADQ
jgi:hypothetical protein